MMDTYATPLAKSSAGLTVIGSVMARENLFHDSINPTIEPAQPLGELLAMATRDWDCWSHPKKVEHLNFQKKINGETVAELTLTKFLGFDFYEPKSTPIKHHQLWTGGVFVDSIYGCALAIIFEKINWLRWFDITNNSQNNC
jgi:hypothetical protein